jgi:hypothetical protein
MMVTMTSDRADEADRHDGAPVGAVCAICWKLRVAPQGLAHVSPHGPHQRVARTRSLPAVVTAMRSKASAIGRIAAAGDCLPCTKAEAWRYRPVQGRLDT